MNQPLGASWSQSEPLATMGAMADEDFSDFLDLDNIDLNFPMFAISGDQQHTQRSCDQEMNAEMRDTPVFVDANQYHGDPTSIPQRQPGLHLKSVMEIVGLDGQSSYFHQHTNFPVLSEQSFQPQPGIPITPNSAEMYPDAACYLERLDLQKRSVMAPGYQYRKDNTVT